MISEATRAPGTEYATSHPVPRLRTLSGRCGVGAKGAKSVTVRIVGLVLLAMWASVKASDMEAHPAAQVRRDLLST